MSEHSPLPWRWWSSKDKTDARPPKYDLARLIGADKTIILTFYGGDGKFALGKDPEAKANAEFIVRTVNAQPEIVALCKVVVDDQISETGNCQACSGETWNHYNDCYVSLAETLLKTLGGSHDG